MHILLNLHMAMRKRCLVLMGNFSFGYLKGKAPITGNLTLNSVFVIIPGTVRPHESEMDC